MSIEADIRNFVRGKTKDVTPHYIHSNDTLPATDLMGHRQRPIQEVLQAADMHMPDADIFLRDKQIEIESLCSRLEHRATMMRERAEEFDKLAHLMRSKQFPQARAIIESIEDHASGMRRLLREHAHIEPTRVSEEGNA